VCARMLNACVSGASAGYHRYWSHRSFEACLPLQIFLAVIGTIAFQVIRSFLVLDGVFTFSFLLQGSAKWWALRHRIHHRARAPFLFVLVSCYM
jgi:stearoyl-CoA desaturase (delta-9 desaturase)